MTLTNAPCPAPEHCLPAVPEWHPRREVDVYAQQVSAIDRFNRIRRIREQAAAAAGGSRERRMDAARSMDVLRRQHNAVVARSHEHLQDSVRLLQNTAERRVVLAHRNSRFLSAIARTLEDQGVRVLCCTDNGADAVGVIVAEQPDLVLVEDRLDMVAGLDVIREVRCLSPQTLVTAQVGYGERVRPLRDAGASTVFPRDVAPQDVALRMLELVCAV